MAARKASAVGARTAGPLLADHPARANRCACGCGGAAKRAFEAMMTMKKIDIAAIEQRGEADVNTPNVLIPRNTHKPEVGCRKPTCGTYWPTRSSLFPSRTSCKYPRLNESPRRPQTLLLRNIKGWCGAWLLRGSHANLRGAKFSAKALRRTSKRRAAPRRAIRRVQI